MFSLNLKSRTVKSKISTGMKKYLSIGLVLVGFLIAVNVKAISPTTIFSDNFGANGLGTDYDEINWNSWSNGGNSGDDAEIRVSGGGNDSASPDGERFVVVLGEDGYICRVINASGYNNLKLSYYWRGDSDAENDDDGIVEYSTGGSCSSGSWPDLKVYDISNDSSWTNQSEFDLPTSLNNSTFRIKFRVNSSQNDEHFRVDGILITGYPVVTDTTPPVLTLPADINTEATSPAGATVTFTASANDETDPATPTVSCAPSSGSTFPLGTTAVNCSATDTAGNTANGSFNVTVQDTTAPSISLNGSNPMDVQVHNAYPEPGAVVTDIYDTGLSATISGTVDIDTVGSYMVYYDAIDSSGNSATQQTRTINVIDQESPSTSDNVPSGWQKTDVTVTLSCTDNVACARVYYTTDDSDPATSTSSFVDASNSWQFTVTTEGQYTIKYFGVDTSDNIEAIKTATNQLQIDKTFPVITIIGNNPNRSYINMYNDEGATASDNIDGDLTSNIVTVNTITNNRKVGNYTVTYTVTDSAGNTTVVVRNVTIYGPGRGGSGSTGEVLGAETGPEDNGASTTTEETIDNSGDTATTTDTVIYIQEPAPAGEVLGAEIFKFLIDLRFRDNNNDVMELQKRLTTEGLFTASTTGYFGPVTRASVIAYQEKYASEILTPLGLTKGTGFVGPYTRAKLNQ